MTTAITHAPQTAEIVTSHQRGRLIKPIAPMADIISAHKALDELIEQNLEEGPNKDYGPAPGAKKDDKKRILYKSGAEKVNKWHGVYPHYDIVEKEVNHDVVVPWRKTKRVYNNAFKGDDSFKEVVKGEGESLGIYRYVIRCSLIYRETGEIIGDGIGACSTLESKYIDRPRDLENTVVKMSQKRALLAATLNAYALSDRFTQDLEDMQSDDDDEKVETGKTHQKAQQAEDVDARGIAIVVFGADSIRGKPIDDASLSLEFLLSYHAWFLKNGDSAERFANASKQIKPEIERRIKAGAFENDDATKVILWIQKKDERRIAFQWMLDAFAQHRADDEAIALAKQKADAEAEIAENAKTAPATA